MVAVITHLALGVVAVQGAVLAVRLDTGFTLEVGVQVEPTLTRVAPRAAAKTAYHDFSERSRTLAAYGAH